MDLIGLPWQVVVGPKGVERGVVELKRRADGERHELSPDSALARLTPGALRATNPPPPTGSSAARRRSPASNG
jgi:hypothetical protein